MSVRHDLAIGGVNAREVLVVTLADLEGAVLRIAGCIVGTTDAVVDVLTIVSGMRASRVAKLQAEGLAAHEAAKAL